MNRLKCFLGYHEWRRIGSAPATLTTKHPYKTVWDEKGTSLVPLEHKSNGFIILTECRYCPAERGYGEYSGRIKKHTAAFARSFIEDAQSGEILKTDR